MEGVWDQGDDEVVLGDGGVKGLCVVDIEGGGLGVLDAGGELLGGLEGPAGCREVGEAVQVSLGGERRQIQTYEPGKGFGGTRQPGGWDGSGDRMGLRIRGEGERLCVPTVT